MPFESDEAREPTPSRAKNQGWTLVDARAERQIRSLRLSCYARNIFDAFYMTNLFTRDLGTAGDSRELGMGTEARF